MGEATTRVYRKGILEAAGFPVADVSEYLGDPDTVVWVDLFPTREQLDELTAELELHELGVLGVEVRAGVHTGEVETIDGKVGGMGVVIGARVWALAGPSEVVVSQTMKDLVAGSGLVFDDAGEHELKGVPDRWRLYRVMS